MVDSLSGETLGSLVDVHREGLMILAGGDMQVDHIYQVSLQPEDAEDLGNIPLGLDCVWTRPCEKREGCWAGFRIIDASDEALEAVSEMVSRYGFVDSDD